MKKIIIGGITAVLGTIGVMTYLALNPKHDYVKPNEIVSELLQERRENPDLNKNAKLKIGEIQGIVNKKNLKKKDIKYLENILFSDCGVDSSQKTDYINDLIRTKPQIEFEYALKDGEGVLVGVSFVTSEGREPHVLYGKSIENLVFNCDYLGP